MCFVFYANCYSTQNNWWISHLMVHVTVKKSTSPILDYECWARSWSWFLGSQSTADFIINQVIGCHYFPPGPQLLSEPKKSAPLSRYQLILLSNRNCDCFNNTVNTSLAVMSNYAENTKQIQLYLEANRTDERHSSQYRPSLDHWWTAMVTTKPKPNNHLKQLPNSELRPTVSRHTERWACVIKTLRHGTITVNSNHSY